MFSRIINYTVKKFETCKNYLPKNEKLNNCIKKYGLKYGFITIFICTTPITYKPYSDLLGLSVNRKKIGYDSIRDTSYHIPTYINRKNLTYFERCLSISDKYKNLHYIPNGPFLIMYYSLSYIIISTSYVLHACNLFFDL